MTNNPHSHSHKHPHADNENETSLVPKIGMFLEAHFGFEALEYHEPEAMDESEQGEGERHPAFVVTLPEGTASVNLNNLVRPNSIIRHDLFCLERYLVVRLSLAQTNP